MHAARTVERQGKKGAAGKSRFDESGPRTPQSAPDFGQRYLGNNHMQAAGGRAPSIRDRRDARSRSSR